MWGRGRLGVASGATAAATGSMRRGALGVEVGGKGLLAGSGPPPLLAARVIGLYYHRSLTLTRDFRLVVHSRLYNMCSTVRN